MVTHMKLGCLPQCYWLQMSSFVIKDLSMKIFADKHSNSFCLNTHIVYRSENFATFRWPGLLCTLHSPTLPAHLPINIYRQRHSTWELCTAKTNHFWGSQKSSTSVRKPAVPVLVFANLWWLSLQQNCRNPVSSVYVSAVKRSIGFTIGFHNHWEGPYQDLFLVGTPTQLS